MNNGEYVHVDVTELAADRKPSWCKKLWCNLWSSTIEANTWSLIYWQIFFVLVDVVSALYTFVLDEKLAVSDTWGLINDAVSVPVIGYLILTLHYRHSPWLDRLSLVLVVMGTIYFFGVILDVLDLVWVTTDSRSTRIGQSVIILMNDLFSFWLWVNFCYYVPILKRAWNDII